MAGFSPAARRSRATSAARGVLPRPPIARLPMLTTGARRDVADMLATASDTPERADNPTSAGERQDLADGIERSVFRAPVGLHKGPRRGAEPGALDRIAHQPGHHL